MLPVSALVLGAQCRVFVWVTVGDLKLYGRFAFADSAVKLERSL